MTYKMRPTCYTLLFLYRTFSISLILSAVACSASSHSPTESALRPAREYPAFRAPRPEDAYRQSSAIAPVAFRQPNTHISGDQTRTRPANSETQLDKDSRTPTPSELGSRWLYGAGFGRSLLNVGTSIAFPPYALYLVGNAGLEVSGLPTLYVSNALPKRPRGFIMSFYEGITSVPGRLAALVGGVEYNESATSAREAANLLQLHPRKE